MKDTFFPILILVIAAICFLSGTPVEGAEKPMETLIYIPMVVQSDSIVDGPDITDQERHEMHTLIDIYENMYSLPLTATVTISNHYQMHNEFGPVGFHSDELG